MSADTLTPASRDFYERAKGKVALSIAVSAIGLAFLGFTACAGGEASAANNALDYKGLSNDEKTAHKAILGGSGESIIANCPCNIRHPFTFTDDFCDRICGVYLYFGLFLDDIGSYLYFSVDQWVSE